MSLRLPPLKAVFTDLDGTLTVDGKVPPSTLQALVDLKQNGFWCVLTTGRPAGWADCLMQIFPFDAALFENGAGYYHRRETRVELVGLAAQENGPARRSRLLDLYHQAKDLVPNARLATDQAFRLYDYAIDHSEEKPHLTASDIEKILQLLRAEPGVVAKPSSTHINYLFGEHTKRTGAQALLATEGKRLGISSSDCVFIGDSLNDEPMFDYFEHCVGVANIADCWEQLSSRPKQITKSQGGRGFEELAFCLLTP